MLRVPLSCGFGVSLAFWRRYREPWETSIKWIRSRHVPRLYVRTVNHAALLAQGFNVRTSRDKDGIEHGGAHAFEMVVWLNAFATCNNFGVSLLL